MNSIVYTIIMVALWVLNLFNDSGLGHIYQTTERARTIIVLLFIIVIMYLLDFLHNNLFLLVQVFELTIDDEVAHN